MKTVAFCTLGCKVNSYETSSMATLFREAGYEVSDFSDVCDVYVINTCSVTAESDRKSRQMIRRARKVSPGAVIAAVGCYAQTSPEKLAEIEGLDVIAGVDERSDIVRIVESFGDSQVFVGEISRDYTEISSGQTIGRTRATLKIQDGCDAFCAYCVIPLARGRSRSRRPESVVREAKSLAERGFCDITLIGIHLSSYGKDLNGVGLADIIEEVGEISGVERIRLGSLSPSLIDDGFVERILGVPKLCPHFHLSLQSGCTETLARMGRRYTMEEYLDCLEHLRRVTDAAVTTDVMVGFPGETEDEFEESLRMVELCGFSDLHVFPYSPRPGTRAAEFEGQVEESVKKRRAAEMAALGRKMRQAFLERMVGREYEVLFEEKGIGLTKNYVKVKVLGGSGVENVMITNVDGDCLVGEII